MEKTEINYPCQWFSRKNYPAWIKYPFQGDSDSEARSLSLAKLVEEENEEEASKLIKAENDSVYNMHNQKCFYPYFLPYNRYHRPILISSLDRQFLNSWERQKENLVCISPLSQDSYEVLCKIPECEPEPVKYTTQREEFNPQFCVFCDKSLYKGGYILDLHNSVPGIKRQSVEKDDDIAYRIGIRTRIHVHKSCYDTYTKNWFAYLPNGGNAESNPGI